MKKSILATLLILITSTFVFTQTAAPTDVGTPAGAGDSNLQNNDVKLRAVELDRIRREANKNAVVRRDDGVELNFSMLKNDFEGIQLEQAKIIKAYQSGDKIDYKSMNGAAAKITEMTIRLKANLFSSNVDPQDSKYDSKDSEVTQSTDAKKKSVRNMIVDLDNAIGELIINTMFQNLKVVNPVLSRKAEKDLDDIIRFSGDLWLESNKMKAK